VTEEVQSLRSRVELLEKVRKLTLTHTHTQIKATHPETCQPLQEHLYLYYIKSSAAF